MSSQPTVDFGLPVVIIITHFQAWLGQTMHTVVFLGCLSSVTLRVVDNLSQNLYKFAVGKKMNLVLWKDKSRMPILRQ